MVYTEARLWINNERPTKVDEVYDGHEHDQQAANAQERTKIEFLGILISFCRDVQWLQTLAATCSNRLDDKLSDGVVDTCLGVCLYACLHTGEAVDNNASA